MSAEQLPVTTAGPFLQAHVSAWLSHNLLRLPFVHLAGALPSCAVSPATIPLAASWAVGKVEVTSVIC